MKQLLLAAIILLPYASQAAPEDARRYNAQETIRRAQIGTYSPRLQKPVPVSSAPSRPERVECWRDASRPLYRVTVCETVRR